MKFGEGFWSTLGKYSWLAFLALGSIGTLTSFWYVANKRDYTPLESYFLQILIAFVGLAVSFYSGRQSVREAAREIVKSHARPAFRRLLSLRSGLLQLSLTIEATQDAKSREDYRENLSLLEGLVYMIHLTVAEALTDWEEIVPEELEKLKRGRSSDNTVGDGK